MILVSEIIKKVRRTYKIPESIPCFDMSPSSKILEKIYKDKFFKKDYTSIFHNNNESEIFGMLVKPYGNIVILEHVNAYGTTEEMLLIFTKDVNKFRKEYSLNIFSKKIYSNGVYTIQIKLGNASLIKIEIQTKGVMIGNTVDKIISEVGHFLKNKNAYNKMKLPYKRGFLLYGPPGNGKTTLINHVLHRFKEKAICILAEANDWEQVMAISDLLASDKLQNDLKIVIFEDIDGIRSDTRSKFLNMIDGTKKLNNVVFIATTNFPEKVDLGLLDRPSRFDSISLVNRPDKEARRKLIKYYFKNISNKELDEAVELTKTFSASYFKELYCICNIENMTLKQAIAELNKRFSQLKTFGTGSYLG